VAPRKQQAPASRTVRTLKATRTTVRKALIRHSIAIFGPSGAGKTSLVQYLKLEDVPRSHKTTIRPKKHTRVLYEFDRAEKGEAKVLGSTVITDIPGSSSARYDVPTLALLPWYRTIHEQNPTGVIYVIDTSAPDDEREGLEVLADMYSQWRANFPRTPLRLRTLLVMLNKFDLWGTDPGARQARLLEYENEVLRSPIRVLQKNLGEFEVLFGATSLLEPDHGPATDALLQRFSSTLTAKRRRSSDRG